MMLRAPDTRGCPSPAHLGCPDTGEGTGAQSGCCCQGRGKEGWDQTPLEQEEGGRGRTPTRGCLGPQSAETRALPPPILALLGPEEQCCSSKFNVCSQVRSGSLCACVRALNGGVCGRSPARGVSEDSSRPLRDTAAPQVHLLGDWRLYNCLYVCENGPSGWTPCLQSRTYSAFTPL